jgi:hypothetical protein
MPEQTKRESQRVCTVTTHRSEYRELTETTSRPSGLKAKIRLCLAVAGQSTHHVASGGSPGLSRYLLAIAVRGLSESSRIR